MPAPSRRFLTRALLAAVLGLTAAFTVACGSSGGKTSTKGLLSAAESRTISGALSAISSGVRAHSCSRTKTAVDALDRSLQNLPASTNSKLVKRLGEGASTVSQLALTQCMPAPKTTTTTTTTAPTTPSTPSTPTTPSTPSTPSTPTTPSTPSTSSTPQTTPSTTPSTPTTTPGAGGSGGSGGSGGAGGGAGLTGGGSQ